MSVPSPETCALLHLVRCALNGETPQMDRLAEADLSGVFSLAQRHLLTAACSLSLERAGIVDRRFTEARGKALRKCAAMDVERVALGARLDAAGIWYLPLKGCVLQDLYPSYGMRQMSDTDLLFDAERADEAREIMEGLGFETVSFGEGAHDVYHKEPVCNFELHRTLFGEGYDARVSGYYREVSRFLVPDAEGSAKKHLSWEDFYVYLLAHEHKHYRQAGIGLRALADVFVCVRAFGDGLDWGYVNVQLDCLGLREFERQNRELAVSLFGGDGLPCEHGEILAYMAESGAYGTVDHVLARQVAEQGRFGYLLRRAFLSREAMATLYPALNTWPMLLPACWALRLVTALATKPQAVRRQLRAAFK